METPPNNLIERVKFLKINGYDGFNVTIPLKVPISLFLDENGLNDLKKKLEDKMKIEGMDEDKIMENLTFYDDKKF